MQILMNDMSYWLKHLYWLGKFLRKKVPYSIIPKYFHSIKDEENNINIKVIYWKLDFENSTLISN